MMPKPNELLALALLLVAAGCITTSGNSAESGQLGAATSSRWTESVLASMTLREKAAQIVWPSVLGDYASGDSPQWRRLTQYIQQDKVGGFTISVGSPTEVAAKLNALQSMSKVPLLFGADLEAGAGFRGTPHATASHPQDTRRRRARSATRRGPEMPGATRCPPLVAP